MKISYKKLVEISEHLECDFNGYNYLHDQLTKYHLKNNKYNWEIRECPQKVFDYSHTLFYRNKGILAVTQKEYNTICKYEFDNDLKKLLK